MSISPGELQGNESTEFQSNGQNADGQTSDDGQQFSLASDFLSRIPENEREIVGKYVKQWDAGVTRRFQDIHNRYKPVADFEPDDLAQITEVYRVLNEEPERLYQALKEQLEGENAGQGEQNPESQTEQLGGELQGVPPELMQRIDQQQQVLEAIASFILDNHKETQQQQEDKELDDYLGLLKEEYGEFDEDWVLAKMYRGMDGEEAVKSWKNMIQEQINKASSVTEGLPPATLSNFGGGAVPMADQQNLSQVPSKDIRKLIANVLTHANQNSL